MNARKEYRMKYQISMNLDGSWKVTPILSMHDISVKTCPECFRVVYNAVKHCYSCGHQFYERKPRAERPDSGTSTNRTVTDTEGKV